MAETLDKKVPCPNDRTGEEDLELHLKTNGMIPGEEQAYDCYIGLSILKQALLGEHSIEVADDLPHTFMSTIQGVMLLFAPIGAYFLDCWDTSATILCSMAGTPSEETFFDLALQRLRRNQDIVLMNIDKTGQTMFQISIKGYLFSIQYHQSPYTGCWHQTSKRGLRENVALAPGAKRRFNAYRDTLYMRSLQPNRKTFKYAYLAIKLWARCHGIFSESFGFLDEITLLYMVTEVSCQLEVAPDVNAGQIVSNFFNYFGSMKLAEFVVGDITSRGEDLTALSHPSHGIAVYSYHSPSYDLSNVKTTKLAEIVHDEIANSRTLMQGEWNWETLLGKAQINATTSDTPSPPFILTANPLLGTHLCANKYAAFIRIEAAHWGASAIGQGRYFESIHAIAAEFARKISLKQAHGLSARPWPTRLRIQRDEVSDMPGPYHDAFYLIGLRISPESHPRPPDARSQRTDFEALKAILRKDISDLETHTNSLDLETDTSFFTVSLVQENELGEHFVEDDRSWGPIPIDEAELDELDDEDPTSEEPQPTTTPTTTTKPKVNRATKPKKGALEEDLSACEDVARSSLRPALDVLNRLRFDSSYAIDDYVIGYEDRHAGIMEMAVTSWKTLDSTVEDFIPQSRIVYYKRKSDGVEVWNRRKRLDAVFGSGVRRGGG